MQELARDKKAAKVNFSFGGANEKNFAFQQYAAGQSGAATQTTDFFKNAQTGFGEYHPVSPDVVQAQIESAVTGFSRHANEGNFALAFQWLPEYMSPAAAQVGGIDIDTYYEYYNVDGSKKEFSDTPLWAGTDFGVGSGGGGGGGGGGGFSFEEPGQKPFDWEYGLIRWRI